MIARRRALPIDSNGDAWPAFDDAAPAGAGARRIYAIGDVHGHADLLAAMQEAIAEDLARHPADDALVIYLGDLIDRGPASAAVVEAIIDSRDMRPGHVEIMCLRGNHDQWLISFIDDATVLSAWVPKGGLETLVSYGLTAEEVCAGVADAAAAGNVRRRFLSLITDRHKEFMLSLPFSHSEGDYFFVHAGVDPDRPLADQRHEDMTWIRDKFLLSRKNFGKVVVHGHSHRVAVESFPNRINVDTGAYVQQVLSCVILEGTERHLLQVGRLAEAPARDLAASEA
jgi:serine/threonine protein phosphatase 1